MSSVWQQAILYALAVAVGGTASYLARRQVSRGTIRTTEAQTLWNASEHLRTELSDMVEDLREELADEKKRCNEEIQELTKKCEDELDEMRDVVHVLQDRLRRAGIK